MEDGRTVNVSDEPNDKESELKKERPQSLHLESSNFDTDQQRTPEDDTGSGETTRLQILTIWGFSRYQIRSSYCCFVQKYIMLLDWFLFIAKGKPRSFLHRKKIFSHVTTVKVEKGKE